MSGVGAQIKAKLHIVKDVGFVSFGRYGQYLVTLVTLPLTARVLGTSGVGLLAISMSAYFLGSLGVDLGITTFLAARVHDEDLNQLRGNYLFIRACILALLGLGLAVSLIVGVPDHLHMIFLGLFAGGVSSFGDDWVLLGQSRFGLLVLYQSFGRITYLILLIGLLPVFPNPSVAMLCLLASSFVPLWLTWRFSIVNHGRPRKPHGLRPMLRLGAPILVARMLENTYEQGAATVFSPALSTYSMGIFSASDRPVQAVSSLLDSIGYGLLPRLAKHKDRPKFWSNATKALAAVFGIALVASISLYFAAPLIIPLIFGSNFDSSIPVMRVEAFILPGTAVASFVTTAILPIRKDTRGVLIGSLIGTVAVAFALAIALANHSIWALVWGILGCETLVSCWYLSRMYQLYRRDRNEGVNRSIEPASAETLGEVSEG